MKRAFSLAAVVAVATFSVEASQAESNTFWQWIGLASRPCGEARRAPNEPRYNPDGSPRGFVAAGARIPDDLNVPDGAYVCPGVEITSPFVRLGPNARLIGNVNLRDRAYVDSTVRGDVTIAGDSHITTSNEIRGVGLRDRGLVLMNVVAFGDAEVSGRGLIANARLGDGARATGLLEICNVRGDITRPITRVHGERCEDVQIHPGMAVADYNQRYRGYPYSSPSYVSENCRVPAWDPSRGVWGCRSGEGSYYAQRDWGSWNQGSACQIEVGGAWRQVSCHWLSQARSGREDYQTAYARYRVEHELYVQSYYERYYEWARQRDARYDYRYDSYYRPAQQYDRQSGYGWGSSI